MSHPAFFDALPPLAVHDPLAGFLGASDDGRIEYRYLDVVKLAGHSCPTVAAAYGLTCRALAALYPDSLPERGAIRVEFRDRQDAGVTGVVAAVVSMLTGAAGDGGFKGLAGRFARRGRLSFGADLPLAMRFTRLDDGRRVDAQACPERVPAPPALSGLLADCLDGSASDETRALFGQLWQDRVRRLLVEHGADDAVFVVRPA